MPSGAPPTAIRWLHVPKAGSAFINVAARFGCRDVEPAALPAFEVALNFTRWRESNPHVRCPGLLPRLWALWELLLCGRPLLVHSASAALCSEATLGFGACGEASVVAGPWNHNRSVPVSTCAETP